MECVQLAAAFLFAGLLAKVCIIASEDSGGVGSPRSGRRPVAHGEAVGKVDREKHRQPRKGRHHAALQP